MNTGYREMLRDRLPKMTNYALKYFKCKEKWLTHVYKSWIWIYPKKDMRDSATRELLKLDKKGKAHFRFEDTILWDDLSVQEGMYWKKVASCVSWFRQQHAYIENEYANSKTVGKSVEDIKYDIMIRYICRQDMIDEYPFLDDLCPNEEDDTDVREKKNIDINNFVDYLIDTFENRI